MIRADESAYGSDRHEKLRRIARCGLLGAIAGVGATLSIFVPDWIGVSDDLEFHTRPFAPIFGALELLVSPLSVGPGLVFGLIVGFALRRRGLARGWRYATFAAASTMSYFAAVQLSLEFLVDALDNIFLIGIVAGLFGGGLLAAASAALMPAFRRWRVCGLMTATGGVLGVLLYFPIAYESLPGWLILYAPWQAGYAAAMATAPELLSTDRGA